MKTLMLLSYLTLLLSSCEKNPDLWDGPELTDTRDKLSVDQLFENKTFELMDMSYFAQPEWAGAADQAFSGKISLSDTEMLFPLERAYYEGENIFPGISIDFISHDGELIPVKSEIYINSESSSLWNVFIGTGKVWNEEGDGAWSRASFPLTLTDSYIGQARNCVATFVYKEDEISNLYLQSSQETADLGDGRVNNIRVMLAASLNAQDYPESQAVIANRNRVKSERLPVLPLLSIDSNGEVAGYFDKSLYTNAPTSLGAIIMDEVIYLHPVMTRHGLYPYPEEMRHGVYSVSKSMTGALALFYLAERYGDGVFDELISNHVDILKDHEGWQDVTFYDCLNMVTGTEGGEEYGLLFEKLIQARTAKESINGIATLGDYPGEPGEVFNYATTNLFVLSYAMQKYVEKAEGSGVTYWDLVRENVLAPMGIENFLLRRTLESDGVQGIPLLGYGAWPTLDEVAKVSWLFSNNGNYKGQQLISEQKCREALGRTSWSGINTNNDYRGNYYRHSFWAQDIRAGGCKVNVTYMLGYGGNYVWFLPSGVIAIRLMDEYDLKFKDLVKGVESIRSSCN